MRFKIPKIKLKIKIKPCFKLSISPKIEIYFFYYKYRFWLSFLSITEYTTVTAMLWIEDIGQFDTYG